MLVFYWLFYNFTYNLQNNLLDMEAISKLSERFLFSPFIELNMRVYGSLFPQDDFLSGHSAAISNFAGCNVLSHNIGQPKYSATKH